MIGFAPEMPVFVDHLWPTPYTLRALIMGIFAWGSPDVGRAKSGLWLSKEGEDVFSSWQNSDGSNSTIPPPPIHRVFITQILLALLAALLGWLANPAVGISVLIGASAHVFPQTYFAYRAFRFRGARQITKAVRATRQGLFGKWLLTACILAVTFKLWVDVHLPGLFAGYLVLQVTSWFLYPILINRPR